VKKILIIHGPNLNILGMREVDVYGKIGLEQINKSLTDLAQKEGVGLEIKQSNHEGEIVELIQQAKNKFDALVINPAAYTHTSVAIRDALAAIDIPAVEVHLSNIYAREEFRHTSLTAPVVKGQVSGFGVNSYLLGVRAAIALVNESG